jgi:hypothetical protein
MSFAREMGSQFSYAPSANPSCWRKGCGVSFPKKSATQRRLTTANLMGLKPVEGWMVNLGEGKTEQKQCSVKAIAEARKPRESLIIPVWLAGYSRPGI